MRILVCGGAGYIGSHMARMLAVNGHMVTVFDNLSTGHRDAVRWGELVEGDLLDGGCLSALFGKRAFDAVMHFSARSLVSESVESPHLYYRNNVIGTYNLLEAMRASGVNRLVFSSTAATFGLPVTDLINEDHPQNPINPYGESKLMVERMLRDYAAAYGLRSVSLRYFNAAGADPSAEIGEAHDPETHLIPNVLKSVLRDTPLRVFGNDYDTHDGTCVRDYVHVNDLCRAHLAAIGFMEQNEGAHGFNLGNGRGFSILDVIRAAEEVIGRKIPYDVFDRRSGDPPRLVADSGRAANVFGWTPEYLDLGAIVETAWLWHSKGV